MKLSSSCLLPGEEWDCRIEGAVLKENLKPSKEYEISFNWAAVGIEVIRADFKVHYCNSLATISLHQLSDLVDSKLDCCNLLRMELSRDFCLNENCAK